MIRSRAHQDDGVLLFDPTGTSSKATSSSRITFSELRLYVR
jgi:hypothetical protein